MSDGNGLWPQVRQLGNGKLERGQWMKKAQGAGGWFSAGSSAGHGVVSSTLRLHCLGLGLPGFVQRRQFGSRFHRCFTTRIELLS